jgi:general stress protein YciG
MAGTKAGGLKAAAKNLAKNPNFYAEIGAKGGANGTTGGFAAYMECTCRRIRGSHHKAQCAGAKGGAISRRKKASTSA